MHDFFLYGTKSDLEGLLAERLPNARTNKRGTLEPAPDFVEGAYRVAIEMAVFDDAQTRCKGIPEDLRILVTTIGETTFFAWLRERGGMQTVVRLDENNCMMGGGPDGYFYFLMSQLVVDGLDVALSQKAARDIDDLVESVETLIVETINDDLDDPFLFDGEVPEGSGLDTRRETPEEMARVGEAMLVCGRARPTQPAFATIEAAFAGNPATLSKRQIENVSTLGQALFAALIDYFAPRGDRYEYNDGHSCRSSGYSRYAETLCLETEVTSALEHALARDTVKTWIERRYAAVAPVEAARLLENLAKS